jgi:hypothetical protein
MGLFQFWPEKHREKSFIVFPGKLYRTRIEKKIETTIKVKGKVIPVQAMKAHRVARG